MRLVVAGKPIIDWDRRRRNIEASKTYPRFKPQEGTTGPVAMCAAGLSLLKTLPILKALHAAGIPICAIKGVAGVLLAHGIVPKYAVFLDSRPDQIRLLDRTHPDITYCLGSQIDPAIYQKLEEQGCQIRVFNGAEMKLFTEPNTDFITGGSTSGMRAINLMRWAGYTAFHLFGYDCSVEDGGSHVYDKTNNTENLEVTIAGKKFMTRGELAAQHCEFLEEYVAVDEPLNCHVYGNGALAHSIRSAAAGRRDVWMEVPDFPAGSAHLFSKEQIAAFRANSRIHDTNVKVSARVLAQIAESGPINFGDADFTPLKLPTFS